MEKICKKLRGMTFKIMHLSGDAYVADLRPDAIGHDVGRELSLS